MKWLVLILPIILLGGAYCLYPETEGGEASSFATALQPASTSASAGAASMSELYAFEPETPLPAPAAVSSGPEEERAILLAQQVLAGGDGVLPALVAALQQAGFPIRDATGKIVAQPVGKSQGIVFELWEVNALAGLYANRRQLTVPLDNFAETLASFLPELQGAPMTDLLLDGVRDRARDPDGSLLFWAAFIAELGRQARVHEAYDILFDIDPAKTQLDSLQIALITRRLAADIAVLVHPDRAGKKLGFQLFSWPVVEACAAEPPCKFEGVEAEIMDWAAAAAGFGFGSLLGYLEDQGLSKAERLSIALSFINVALAYGKLGIAQAAFDIKFEMAGGTPLVRTQQKWPETGERKTIVATLKMDMGKIQWVNCFRIMLNAVSLDLNVENDGPIEGASVSWSGESGFGGHLVQYVGDSGRRIQTGGSFSSPILDARTDKSGRASVDVEGVGQRQDLGGDPKPVMEEATASAMVVIKPANIYRDFKDATMLAMSGLSGLLVLPADLMYRTRWSFGGWYTFPVKDWKPGNDAWTGTITDTMVKRQIVKKTVDSKCCGGRPITSTQSDLVLETVQQRWEINSDANAKALTPEFAMATASYSVNAGVTSKSMLSRTGWNMCKGGPEATWSQHTLTEKASASLSGRAEVTINIDEDGSYSVSAGGPDDIPVGERITTSVLAYGPNCGTSTPNQTSQKKSSYSPNFPGPMIQGKIDPDKDDRMSGRKTEVEKDSKVGILITHTYTWNLTRRR